MTNIGAWGFRDWGLGFRANGDEYRGSGCRGLGSVFRAKGDGYRLIDGPEHVEWGLGVCYGKKPQ